MQADQRPDDPQEDDNAILARMLVDARRLCASTDALLVGQYDHLRGRIAALMELTAPLASASKADRGRQ